MPARSRPTVIVSIEPALKTPVIVNEPPSKDPKFFNGDALTYYGRLTYKFEQAARKGAVGVLIIHRTDLASYGWDVVRNSWSGEQVYLGNDTDPKLKVASWIQLGVARQLFDASNLKLDEMIAAAGTRQFQAKELPVRFKAHVVSQVRKFQAYNVLGLLPGANAAAAQALVYSAHYDHLGIDEGAACLVIERQTWRNGEPITAVRITHPGHLYDLIARFTPTG